MSELYELPDGWEWKTISDVIKNIKTGTTPPKKEQKYYDNPSIKWYSPSDFGEHKELINSKNEINKISIEEKKAKIYESNSLLLVAIGATVGKIGIIREEASSNQQITVLKFNDEVNVDYSYYWFKQMKQKIVNKASSATMPIINQKGIISLPFPYVLLKEQKRIVSKLDTLFEKIDKAIELHEKNIKEANAFMGSVLNEVFEELEEKYEKKQLKDIVSLLGDGLHGTPKYDEMGEYYFINGSNLLNNRIAYKDNTKKVSKLEFDKYKKNLNDRTVLVSINGTVGNVGLYNNEKCILGKSACYFNLLSGIDKVYMTYVIRNGTFQRYIRENATGSTIMNISLKTMRAYNFVVPPIKTQQKTVKYLDEVSQKIEKTKAIQKEKLQNLKDLKASILDQAFKGQL